MFLQTIKNLLEKEVNRKQFLIYIGGFFLAITGISAFLKNIHEVAQSPSLLSSQPVNINFGNGPYGGLKEETK